MLKLVPLISVTRAATQAHCSKSALSGKMQRAWLTDNRCASQELLPKLVAASQVGDKQNSEVPARKLNQVRLAWLNGDCC